MIELIHKDCMELLKDTPDKFYDLAIVDPPYGIGADKAQNNAAEQRIKANGKSKAGRGWQQYKNTEWDNETPKEDYFIELFRVSKNQIIWGGNYFPFIWQYSSGFILWNKMQRDFSLADGELAWYSQDKAMRIFDMSRAEALFNNKNNGGRFHPTQKPVKLYEWLLMNYAKEGDKILDTHGGSMSIALAVHNVNQKEQMNLSLTLTELDEDYYKAGVKRYENHIKQKTIFDL